MIAHFFGWFASAWWWSLGRSGPFSGGLPAVLGLGGRRSLLLGGLGLSLLALLFAALQAHVHLVLLLHLAHLGQVEADAVAVEPVVAAPAADHEPGWTGAVLFRAQSLSPVFGKSAEGIAQLSHRLLLIVHFYISSCYWQSALIPVSQQY